MFTLRQLRYLVALSDTLSFRRAAERCHVAQPTLSVQIRELEAHLGVQLFERTRRRVTLTPLGREIAERARSVLRESQDILDLARSASRPLAGPLRLGLIATLGPYLLPYVLSAFREAHPDLRLYVREDPARRLVDRLREGELDLALVDMPVDAEGLEGLSLFREPLWLAVPRGHLLDGRDEIAHQALKGQELLMLEEGHCLRAAVQALCDQMGASEHTGFQATSLDTLRQMVASRIGPAILPALYVAAEAAQDSQISTIPFASPQPERHVVLLWRPQSARKDEFREFAAFISARLPGHVVPDNHQLFR
jgi:LysR family hydrogen peroxide-inducible transcriptional activator